MRPEIASLQSWTEFSALRDRVSSNLSSPSKLRVFADLNRNSLILYKTESCNLNFLSLTDLRYYRLYLAKPLIWEVTTPLTTPPGAGKTPEERR